MLLSLSGIQGGTVRLQEIQFISGIVPWEYIWYTLLVIAALAIILSRVIPMVARWFNALRANVNNLEDMAKSIKKHDEGLRELNDKVRRDYDRLNALYIESSKHRQYIDDSLRERELIIRSLLGITKGLQELGANGPTKAVEKDIEDYLLNKTHDTRYDSSHHII